ncbi:uncharacterized protein DS421_18g623040 [Arachis hypogaea]|nr:uncharacterized protein DS421_18g623040 [Arachis hypogaea]
MLSGSNTLAFRRAFLELHKSKWSVLNGYGKLTSRSFHQCIIAHTLLQIRRPKTGVQRQPPAPFQASSAQGKETSVQTPKEDPLASVKHPRGLIARGIIKAQPKHSPSGLQEWISTLKRPFYPY